MKNSLNIAIAFMALIATSSYATIILSISYNINQTNNKFNWRLL